MGCGKICFGYICSVYTSTCCFVLSLWGVIMLGLLGVFFKIQAVALFEDIPLKEDSFNTTVGADNQRHMYLAPEHQDAVRIAYYQAAIVSWIAAGVYAGFFALSTTFMVINFIRGKSKTT